jgi:methyltransferase
MVKRLLFAGFVAALGIQRLFELRLSRRNERQMRQRGGREHASETYKWIVGLHAAWFAALLVEAFVGKRKPAASPANFAGNAGDVRKFHHWLSALALGLFGAGQALRFTAIRTLGRRWSTRIITVPGEAPVRRGIYRYIRHPNYLGVELEILAVPLMHSAYLTSAVFGIANALLLRDRIRREEQALEEDNQYQERPGDDPGTPANRLERILH